MNVVDVEAGRVLADRTVAITGDRITGIHVAAITTAPATKRIDGRGKYVMPGLWDMHVHLFRHSPRFSNDAIWFPLFVANGVTGVRDMFSNFEDLVMVKELRSQVAGGRPGPRIVAAGSMVDGDKPVWPGSLVATTPDEGREIVNEIRARGGDFVKVYSKLSRDTYLAIADESKRIGIDFAGHVPEEVRVAEASDLGQTSQEHLRSFARDCARSERSPKEWIDLRSHGRFVHTARLVEEFDLERCKPIIERIVKNGTWMTLDPVMSHTQYGENARWRESPNLRYVPTWIQDSWKPDPPAPSLTPEQLGLRRRVEEFRVQITQALAAAGARLIAGTDVGVPYQVPGFSLHENLELLVTETQLPTAAVLRMATIEAARFVRLESSHGSVAVGKFADLVLLTSDPLADIRNTQRIDTVILGGRVLGRAALDGLLREAEIAARGSRKPDTGEASR